MQETVIINRLYHRELIGRMDEIDELEKKWNCRIIFPSTETASDVVTISGPEYQVPQAVDEFLVCIEFSPKRSPMLPCPRHCRDVTSAEFSQGMVPESNEIGLPSSPELREFLQSDDFRSEVQHKLKTQYEVDLEVTQEVKRVSTPTGEKTSRPMETLLLMYTRNNAGGVKDAVEFLMSRLVAHGLDVSTIKSSTPRPKSDSFEDNLPFFNSKLLQHAPAPVVTTSPVQPTPVEEASERSIFDRLRKPGSISSISSFLERRKNHHQSNSAGSIFRNGSSNCSKASLVSIESQSSSYRNPWNDSGVNLVDEDHPQHGQNGGPQGHQQQQQQGVQQTVFAAANGGWPVRPTTNKIMTSPTGPGMMGVNMSMSMMNVSGGGTGEHTPRYDVRASFDSGRPSTSHSMMGVGGVGGGFPNGHTNGHTNGNMNMNGNMNGNGGFGMSSMGGAAGGR